MHVQHHAASRQGTLAVTSPHAGKEQHQQTLRDDIDAVRTMILHHADSKTELPPVQASAPSPLTYPFVITPECAMLHPFAMHPCWLEGLCGAGFSNHLSHLDCSMHAWHPAHSRSYKPQPSRYVLRQCS